MTAAAAADRPGAILRVVSAAPASGAANMAADEALLDGDGPLTLRLYGWSPATVSLGRFQPDAAFDDLPSDVERVRRLTGGGAIWHADELTFALAGPSADFPTSSNDDDLESAYRVVHDALAAALHSVDVPTERLVDGPSADPRARDQRWCFARPGRHDLVTPTGEKLVGSAQRRVRRPRARVLMHGSIPLRRPPEPVHCAAVADFVDPDQVHVALRESIVRELSRALDREPVST